MRLLCAGEGLDCVSEEAGLQDTASYIISLQLSFPAKKSEESPVEVCTLTLH